MPVHRVNYDSTSSSCSPNLDIDELDQLFSTLDIEAAARIGEVVLQIDNQQRALRIVGGHLTVPPGCARFRVRNG